MGFFGDLIKDACKDAVKGVSQWSQDMARYKAEYENFSDDRLVGIYKSDGFFSSSQTEKMCALNELTRRHGKVGAKALIMGS